MLLLIYKKDDMEKPNSQPLEERDLDEAAHEQLKEEQKVPIIPVTPTDDPAKPFDPDEEAHRQLEDGQ